MITRYLFWAEVLELEYTDDFHAHVTFKSTEHGLRCEISLCDGEGDEELVIGTIISKEYDMEASHDYAVNMLEDEDFCFNAWRQHSKRRRKRKNAAR